MDGLIGEVIMDDEIESLLDDDKGGSSVAGISIKEWFRLCISWLLNKDGFMVLLDVGVIRVLL